MTESAVATAYARVFPDEPFPGEAAACEFMVAEILVQRDIAAATDTEKFGVMREQNELHYAHDLLSLLLVHPVLSASLAALDKDIMKFQVGVLCWALRHDHNTTFGEFLKLLSQLVRAEGFAPLPETERREEDGLAV